MSFLSPLRAAITQASHLAKYPQLQQAKFSSTPKASNDTIAVLGCVEIIGLIWFFTQIGEVPKNTRIYPMYTDEMTDLKNRVKELEEEKKRALDSYLIGANRDPEPVKIKVSDRFKPADSYR